MRRRNVFLRRVLYDYPLRRKLNILALLITIIPVMLLGTIQVIYSVRTSIKQREAALSESMDSTVSALESFFGHILIISDKIAMNRSVQDALLKPCTAPLEYLERNRYIVSIINPILNINWTPTSSALQGMTPLVIYSSFFVNQPDIASANFVEIGQQSFDLRSISAIEKKPWYRSIGSEPTWLTDYDEDIWAFPVISVTRRFSHIRTRQEIGVASVEVQLQVLINYFNRMSGDKTALLLNGDQIVARSGQKISDSLTSRIISAGDGAVLWDENTPYSIYSATLKTTGWRVVFLNEYADLMRVLRDHILLAVLVSVGCYLSVAFLMMMLTRNITARLSALTLKMRQIDVQLKQPNTPIEGEDEFGQLDRQFYEMIERLNRLMAEKQAQVRVNSLIKAELLQQQVNPHLLYNSLSAIRYLSTERNNDEIGVITNMLIRFYRNSLNQGDVFFKIEDELQLTRDYIQLMCRVYQLDILVSVNVEDGLEKARCLKLILQPVIENALMHGLRTIKRQGNLSIRIHKDTSIVIEIYDNGLGIALDRLSDILEKPGKGFGLRSVDGRIKLYYGEDYGLFIQSKHGAYTRVTIRIPIQ